MHMKKMLSMLIAALLCLALFGACGAKPAGPDPSTSVPAMTTRPDLALHVEAEKDGLVLLVDTGYKYLFAGEPFVLTASIANTTDKDITYGAGSGTPNMHMEIPVCFEPYFIDMDTYGKIMTDDYRFATLKAGETFTQTMNLMPGPAIGDWYPAGEYKGTATFSWITGTPDDPGETKLLELEFSVILI